MALVRDLAQIAAGPLAGIINALGARLVHRWTLENLDTGEDIQGQFGPVNPTLTPGNSVYAEHTSLNRNKPILQYVHGTADAFSFGAQWFALHEDDDTPEKKIEALRSWAQRDPDLGRPPRVAWWVGDGRLALGPAVIWSIGDISYFDPPKHGGGIRGVITTITLRQYTPYELKSEPARETRYHHTKLGEYFELIAWNEYGNAMLGDVIRKRHAPDVLPSTGDVVALPSLEAIRIVAVKPSSIPFLGITSRKDSPQKQLAQLVLDRVSGSYVSGVVPEGL